MALWGDEVYRREEHGNRPGDEHMRERIEGQEPTLHWLTDAYKNLR